MRQEDTKQKIREKALELFSERGYDSVSVGEIAQAVGIKAPSLYNHYPSKQAIFEAIVASTAERYQRDTDKIQIHVEDDRRDASSFVHITEEALFQKVRQIFEYSLHDDVIRRFRKMMTIEQFRSPELGIGVSRRLLSHGFDALLDGVVHRTDPVPGHGAGAVHHPEKMQGAIGQRSSRNFQFVSHLLFLQVIII